MKKVTFDLDFSDIGIKGRGAGGNLVSKFAVRKIELKEAGVSTLGARKVWYDDTVRRLNADGRGQFLGDFKPDDKILVLLNTGEYIFTGFDLSTHFDERMLTSRLRRGQAGVRCVLRRRKSGCQALLAGIQQKRTGFIGDHEQSKLWVASTLHHPHVRIRYNRRFKHTRDREDDILDLRGFISVKGVKALGNKLSALPVTEVSLEAPVKDLEEAHEKELQAARDADAQREQEAKTPEAGNGDTADAAAATAPAEEVPVKQDSSAESADSSGQASLF